jgi:competence ComEA-like helix-hairpin-helix protein
MGMTYRRSISGVRKDLVRGENILGNLHCTIKYSPRNNIVIMDNKPTNNKKRMLTISKQIRVNVDKKWSDICRIYDVNTTLEALVSFLDLNPDTIVYLDSPSENKRQAVKPKSINIDNSKNGPKFVDMDNVRPDTFGINENVQKTSEQNFIMIGNLKNVKPTEETSQQSPEFVEMGQILSSTSKKIDVNTAEAPELSILPGINIVMAKKIIEYRNLNGKFKNVDEFIKVAGIKEHFISKVKSMIILGNDEKTDNHPTDYDGRIVDF